MIQNKVVLEPISHTYADLEGKKYTSVSHVLSHISEYTDWNTIAGKVAGKGKFEGLNKAGVLDLWKKNKDKAANHGTKIHKILEDYSKTFTVEDEAYLPLAKSIFAQYAEYYQTMDEVCLYNDFYSVAGTTDKVLIPFKNKKIFDMCDYKTNLSGFTFHSKDNKYLLGPVSHLQECMYSKYSLQLSLYAYMYEQLTGWTVRNLFITYIPPDNFLNHQRIPVPYMKDSAIAVLEYFKNKSTYEAKIVNDFKEEEFIF